VSSGIIISLRRIIRRPVIFSTNAATVGNVRSIVMNESQLASSAS
jgi:hypothetical protein